MTAIPWWAWTVPMWPTAMCMAYALLVGVLQRKTTGRYPSFGEWCRAVPMLRAAATPIAPSINADRPATGSEQQADHDGDRATDTSSTVTRHL